MAFNKDSAPKTPYVPRDYDKEARGKTMAMMVAAALRSPFIAGISNTDEEYDVKVEEHAKKAFSMVFKGEEYNG